ncbi:hypothetical protein [Patulibacter sp.]|uniref:hypothetical protein n=1 Tax=Patulibacter sp. TaxID=1912859 RepID=UPI00272854D4|nr:hypothetical protein [Patulibacter sp.]MDO9408046.1 hypothetical protein [Patulibacter sp.]
MTGALERRGELQRLARVLDVQPDELGALDGADVATLRQLRHAVADRLLEQSREQFSRAVALGDALPASVAAKLAQHVMGPVLGGRAAALLSPRKAGDLARRLPADFLADVACHVDVRKVGPLLEDIDRGTMAEAGEHLRRRGEWVVLGAFVGHVRDDVVADLLDGFDGEALLRSGAVIEDPSRIDAVVAMLTDSRLDGLLDAADEHALWTDVVSLNVHLCDAQLQRIASAVERLSGPRIEALAALLAGDDELRAAALPITERLSPAFLADVAAEVDLGRVGGILEGIPTATLAEAAAELGRREAWPLLGRLMTVLPDDVLADLRPDLDDELVRRAEAATADAGESPAARPGDDAAAAVTESPPSPATRG